MSLLYITATNTTGSTCTSTSTVAISAKKTRSNRMKEITCGIGRSRNDHSFRQSKARDEIELWYQRRRKERLMLFRFFRLQSFYLYSTSSTFDNNGFLFRFVVLFIQLLAVANTLPKQYVYSLQQPFLKIAFTGSKCCCGNRNNRIYLDFTTLTLPNQKQTQKYYSNICFKSKTTEASLVLSMTNTMMTSSKNDGNRKSMEEKEDSNKSSTSSTNALAASTSTSELMIRLMATFISAQMMNYILSYQQQQQQTNIDQSLKEKQPPVEETETIQQLQQQLEQKQQQLNLLETEVTAVSAETITLQPTATTTTTTTTTATTEKNDRIDFNNPTGTTTSNDKNNSYNITSIQKNDEIADASQVLLKQQPIVQQKQKLNTIATPTTSSSPTTTSAIDVATLTATRTATCTNKRVLFVPPIPEVISLGFGRPLPILNNNK